MASASAPTSGFQRDQPLQRQSKHKSGQRCEFEPGPVRLKTEIPSGTPYDQRQQKQRRIDPGVVDWEVDQNHHGGGPDRDAEQHVFSNRPARDKEEQHSRRTSKAHGKDRVGYGESRANR